MAVRVPQPSHEQVKKKKGVFERYMRKENQDQLRTVLVAEEGKIGFGIIISLQKIVFLL